MNQLAAIHASTLRACACRDNAYRCVTEHNLTAMT